MIAPASRITGSVAVVACAAWAAMPAAHAGSYHYRLLQVPGQIGSEAVGVTNDDAVAGHYYMPDNTRANFVWRRGAFTLIAVPAGGLINAVNARGFVAGNYEGSSGASIFTYDIATGVETLFPTGRLEFAAAVNGAGKIAGGISSAYHFRGIVATAAKTHLPDLDRRPASSPRRFHI